jgi:S-adenosylmethionine:tRNA ribosyltransferase-isomerase
MKSIGVDISDYDYSLPADRITKYPLRQRDTSKLLVYQKGHISHTIFKNIASYISPDDLVIFNNTRVIQARFLFNKPTGAAIEIFCLEPKDPPEYKTSLQHETTVTWNCLIGNAKKWKKEPIYRTINYQNKKIVLKAEKLEGIDSTWFVRLSWEPPGYSFREILEMSGSTPIPPYLNREPVPEDKYTYQTVYSRVEGSVAAPTAGFHFIPETLEKIRNQSAGIMELTLHVGAGTFRPVLSSEVTRHIMHSEHIYFEKSDLQRLLDFQGTIMAIGTTSTRILETIYWLGCKVTEQPDLIPDHLYLKQWEDHDLALVPKEKSLEALINYFEKNNIEQYHTYTQLMIIPGYRYMFVDKMLTNFHQPKSTLLLLVSAFVGNDWRKIYHYAMDNDFRFLSYGDSSLLIP